ncbi:MAG: type II CAAX endopeptidase family protein [Marinirhabdus sp.]|nr:type II CAAX endopeptidase family protein [Marinirhabdus sp.]
MEKSTKNILIILVSFGLYFTLDALFFKVIRTWFFEHTNQLGISHIIAYAITGVPLFSGVLIMDRRSNFLRNFGLERSLFKGVFFAIICTLPMFIGFSLLFEMNQELKLNTVLIGVIAAGFFEEVYFRGFLFGLLFRKTKLGFILSVLFGAIYFGALHLYQSSDLTETIGIFLITFLGGILYAWVYAEWNFNIWVPIFLHMFMNLAWEVFSVSENALGDLYSNVFRFVTIALIILGTLLYKKRKGAKRLIHKRNLFFSK